MNKTSLARAVVAATLTFALAALAAPAFAASKHGGGHGHSAGAEIGAPGTATDVTRTIEIVMRDNYYEPEMVKIHGGETVRFKIKNAGSLVHEFNIATAEMHVAHQPEMMMMMEHGVLEPDRINWEAAEKMRATMGHGMHDAANSMLLEPGKTAEIIWRFPKNADLQFACNVPGHYDSGMHGAIKLGH